MSGKSGKTLNPNKMVHARLHIICGNCGAKDEFEHQIKTELDHDGDDLEKSVVYISCKNCNTVHDLDDYSTLNQN